METNEKIRIGISLNSGAPPFWIRQIIGFIAHNKQLKLNLILSSNVDKNINHFFLNNESGPKPFLYKYYDRFDRGRVKASIEPYKCEVQFDDNSYHEVISGISRNPESEIDLFIHFMNFRLPPYIYNRSKYGVWQFFRGNSVKQASPILGFWEVYHNKPTSDVILTASDSISRPGNSLIETSIRTDETSPYRNAFKMSLMGVTLFTYAIERIDRHRPSRNTFFSNSMERPITLSEKFHMQPTNFQVLRFLFCQSLKLIKKKITNNRHRDQWSIGVSEDTQILLGCQKPINVNWYIPKCSEFIADPFPVKRDEKISIFVEEYDYVIGRGHISVMELDKNGKFNDPIPVLKSEYHLSFPFIFEEKDKLYMIPEQGQSNRIVLYECINFPDKWVETKTLVNNFAGLDSVIFFHSNRWWLFTTKGDAVSQDNNLHIFFSEHLSGVYKPHPRNPVKNDITSSRMAGSIFTHKTKIIRPAQNCFLRYGESIKFNEILLLSETDYKEREIDIMCPDEKSVFSKALHTINQIDGLTVVDGLREIKYV